MKTFTYVSLALAAAVSVASAQEKKSEKTLGEKTSETLENVKEGTKEAGRAIADTTKKAAETVVDAVTPDKDARKVDVELTDHHLNAPRKVEAGKTAFVVHNGGKEKHNFEVTGQGVDKKFMLDLSPNETKALHVDLKAGEYKILSPAGDHAEEGMKQNLTVK